MGYDEWLDRRVEEYYGDWDGKECDECGADIYVDDLHTDEYYRTPNGDFCRHCAWKLARRLVEEMYENEVDPETEHDEEVDELMNEWRTS